MVVEDDEGIAFVLGRADEDGLDVTDTEVALVLEAEVDYFEAIGAIGGPSTDVAGHRGSTAAVDADSARRVARQHEAGAVAEEVDAGLRSLFR